MKYLPPNIYFLMSIDIGSQLDVEYLESKIIFLGNSDVGKTAIIWRTQNKEKMFSPGEFSPTIGMDSSILFLRGIPNHKIFLWDTAGSERFRSFVTQYFRGVSGVVYVFDVANRSSFESIDRWVKLFKDRTCYSPSGPSPKAILLGNKCDKEQKDRQVSTEEGEYKASMMGIPYFETSALLGTNVMESMEALASRIAKDIKCKSPSLFVNPEHYLREYEHGEKKRGCC